MACKNTKQLEMQCDTRRNVGIKSSQEDTCILIMVLPPTSETNRSNMICSPQSRNIDLLAQCGGLSTEV